MDSNHRNAELSEFLAGGPDDSHGGPAYQAGNSTGTPDGGTAPGNSGSATVKRGRGRPRKDQEAAQVVSVLGENTKVTRRRRTVRKGGVSPEDIGTGLAFLFGIAAVVTKHPHWNQPQEALTENIGNPLARILENAPPGASKFAEFMETAAPYVALLTGITVTILPLAVVEIELRKNEKRAYDAGFTGATGGTTSNFRIPEVENGTVPNDNGPVFEDV